MTCEVTSELNYSNHNLLGRSPVSQLPKHPVDTNILITFQSCATVPFAFLTAPTLPSPEHWAVHFQTRDMFSRQQCALPQIQHAGWNCGCEPQGHLKLPPPHAWEQAVLSVVAPGGDQVCTVVEKMLLCLWESHRTWFKAFSGGASFERFAPLPSPVYSVKDSRHLGYVFGVSGTDSRSVMPQLVIGELAL